MRAVWGVAGGIAFVVLGVLLRRYDPFVDDPREARDSAEAGERLGWALRAQARLWEHTWPVLIVIGVTIVLLALAG